MIRKSLSDKNHMKKEEYEMSGRRMRLAALLVAAAVCAAEVSAGSVTVSAEESQGQADEESPDGQPDGGAREGEENIGCSYRVLEDGIVEITGYTGSEESISIPAQINGMKVAGIGDEAFYECEISGVTLPEGLVYIGNKAFQGSGVSSVSIPQSVEIIGEEAFYGSGLSSVSIPQSVETIGERAFARCGGLESVTFPNQLESIGKGAFERCKSLSSVTFGSGIKYIGDSAFDGCSALSGISLPEGLMGIGVCAFSQSGLSEITIPGSVENIGDRAFWNCRNLSSATFSEGIKSIGESAFNRCNLTQVTLPDSLVSIGENAFSGCDLTSVTLPKSLVSLGGISASAEINVSPENSNYASYGGCLYNKDKTEILKCPSGKTEVTFPEGLQRIGAYAFSGCKDLTGVTLPEGLVSIGESAFSDCGRGQDSITIPSSVTDIAAGAFNGFSLSEITVAPENSEYASVDGCLYNKGKTKLLACPSNNRESEDMKSFPEELTEIGAYAFSGCTVRSVTLPDGVTTIGDGAFSGCTVTNGVTLPDGVTTIGDGAFSGFRINSGETKTITLPESVTHIGDGAFSGCGLSSITIPGGVTKIGKDTFSGNDISSVTLPEGVTEIGDHAFSACGKLTSVTLPEGVTEIGAYAFSGCGKLADVVITGNMVNIGSYAFSGSTNLNSVTISGSVANIGEFAFMQSGIQNFEIPEGLAVIGDDAFSYSGLCSISLPEGLTTIGSRAFEGCSSLASITIPASVTLFGADVFFQCGDLTINGNKEAEYLYRVLEDGTVELDKYNGSEENVVVPAQVNGKNVTSIGGSVFFEHGNLASVTLPDSLTKIGSSAFYECQRLTEITIPAGVTEIGTGAFMNCDNLNSISLPEGLKKLEDRLFSSSGISEIVIPESVECIGSSVFYNCFLDSLRIPANVTSIMHDAFSSCSLGAVDVAPENSRYVSEDGCLYDKEKTKILLCPQSKEEIALAESVTRIGSYAFGRSRMSSLTIPGSVESIGDNAFESSSLTSLSLPESVTSIGDEAFSMCYSLKCIAIPESVTFIGANAFESCRDLTIYGKEGSYAQTYASENHISFSTEEMPTPGEEKAIAAGDVTLSQSFYNYDGTEKEPEVTVVCDGVTLEPGIDYTVSYSDNVEIGKAYAIIQGKGKYTGTVRKEFTIAEPGAKDPAAEGFQIERGRLISYSGNAKEVAVPEGVDRIAGNAFDNSDVVRITIPKGVTLIETTYIGPQVPVIIPFSGCGSLQEIIVDEGNADYASENGVLYGKFEDGRTLIRCPQGKSGTVAIPEGVSIGREAFKGCSKLTGVTLSGCKGSIEAGAFEGCSSLTELAIPEGVTAIRGGAFAGCSSLTSITIPKSVESISMVDGYVGPINTYCSLFADCDSLREVTVDAGNPAYVSEGGALYNKDKTELVLCLPGKSTEVTVAGNVARIGDGAFAEYSQLTDITLPSGVKTVGRGAFFGCRGLARLVIPSGAQSIGEAAFAYCSGLTSLSLPESVTEIGDGAMNMGTNLTIYGKTGSYAETYAKEHGIKFSAGEPQEPAERKAISDSDVSLSQVSYTYDGTEKKPEVTVKCDGVVLTKDTDYTVAYADNVNVGTAKATVTGIGNYKGTVTKEFTIAKADEKDPAAEGFDIRDGMLYSYSGNAKEVIIPENVTQIKADAFDNCSSVTSITIPKSVTFIDGNDAIMIVDKIPFRCGSLQEIKVDEENGNYASVDGILYRKDKKTLIRCPQGKSGKADIPQGVETVQRGAFMGCGSLTSIVFPQGLKGIDRKAFVGCGSLESVSLPQSLEYISLADDYAHMYCSPFAGCDSLKELKVDAGNQVYVFEDGFLYNKEKAELVLCIPGKAEKITVPGNVAHIGAGAFAGYSGLTEIVIPSGVETIGKGAFFGSRNLASVSVPESVTEIGYYAFEGIDNLTIYGKAGSYAETYAKENEIRFSAEPQQPSGKKTISASDVSLSKTSYAYDGKAKKPGVTVRDGKTVLKKGTDYTVSYKGNVNAGTAKAIVTGKGGYKGSVTKTFTIAVKKGTSHKVGSYQYKVTGASTAELTAWKDKKAVKVKVPKEVKIGGKKFKVTAIGKNAFKNNKKITGVEMADNVKKIGASAFEGCAKLSKVTVGMGVTEIGASAFKNCKKLGNITVKSAKLKKVGKDALKGIKPTAKVKVPAKKLSAYQKLLKNKGQGKKVKIVK